MSNTTNETFVPAFDIIAAIYHHEDISSSSSVSGLNVFEGLIGVDGIIPWDCPEDRRHFSRATRKVPTRGARFGFTSTEGKEPLNAVIMGRKTFESLGCKPLKDRHNIVLSKTLSTSDGYMVCCNLDEALRLAYRLHAPGIYVIGGGALYEEALRHPCANTLYLTRISAELTIADIGDKFVSWAQNRGNVDRHHNFVFFPQIPPKFTTGVIVTEELSNVAELVVYRAENHEEQQYLDLVRRLLQRPSQPNRTPVPTRSLVGEQLRFNLGSSSRRILPLLTTKRVPFSGVAQELLFFLRGYTDTKELSSAGVKIWNGNTTREFLDSRGLTTYPEGALGPMYPHQWRHWGAEYQPPPARPSGGIDQIREVLHSLRTDPYSRRHVVTAWNPSDIDKSVLAACHAMFQFVVNPGSDDKKILSCVMTQRSGDMLGIPWNIVSYALLTHIYGDILGYEPGELVVTIGDAHLYENCLEAYQEQINRLPREFPCLEIKGHHAYPDEYEVSDFAVRNYYPYPSIRMNMVA